MRLFRFPRPRGDGPASVTSLSSDIEVSPPTRGWTIAANIGDSLSDGFPAHAGMDPAQGQMVPVRIRFPRPRGDGPEIDRGGFVASGVSPPTRGWTFWEACREASEEGFPAHAGMDLSRRTRRRGRPGFPRPRGDGPCPSSRRIPRTMSFPAHAGMDPPGTPGTASRCRFPRPRGDGPEMTEYDTMTSAVSPPTRGWTSLRELRSTLRRGFPAHAGMDRSASWACLAYRRFPRPRGDGPSPAKPRRDVPTVSPPTRGWTPIVITNPDDAEGFPAHAGMDPDSANGQTSARWFPRPRGDGPLSTAMQAEESGVSPPTRGWTRRHRSGETARRGFPAHAGMDPGATSGSRVACRFPRPRGDGPS